MPHATALDKAAIGTVRSASIARNPAPFLL